MFHTAQLTPSCEGLLVLALLLCVAPNDNVSSIVINFSDNWFGYLRHCTVRRVHMQVTIDDMAAFDFSDQLLVFLCYTCSLERVGGYSLCSIESREALHNYRWNL